MLRFSRKKSRNATVSAAHPRDGIGQRDGIRQWHLPRGNGRRLPGDTVAHREKRRYPDIEDVFAEERLPRWLTNARVVSFAFTRELERSKGCILERKRDRENRRSSLSCVSCIRL